MKEPKAPNLPLAIGLKGLKHLRKLNFVNDTADGKMFINSGVNKGVEIILSDSQIGKETTNE